MPEAAFHSTKAGYPAMRVSDRGNEADVVAAGNVTVANTATLIKAANANRTSIVIQNLGAQLLYIGPSGVTTSNGFQIAITSGRSEVIKSTAAIYGIAASSTVDVRYFEESVTPPS